MHVHAQPIRSETQIWDGTSVWPSFELKATNKYTITKHIIVISKCTVDWRSCALVLSCMLQIVIHTKRIMNIENVEREKVALPQK